MAFKEGFVHSFKLSLRKDIFQLSQGAYATFELVLDSFILLFPVKTFIDVNHQMLYFLDPFDNFIIEDKIWQFIAYPI